METTNQIPIWKNIFFILAVSGFFLVLLIRFVNPLQLKYHDGYDGYGNYWAIIMILGLFFREKTWWKIVVVTIGWMPVLIYVLYFVNVI